MSLVFGGSTLIKLKILNQFLTLPLPQSFKPMWAPPWVLRITTCHPGGTETEINQSIINTNGQNVAKRWEREATQLAIAMAIFCSSRNVLSLNYSSANRPILKFRPHIRITCSSGTNCTTHPFLISHVLNSMLLIFFLFLSSFFYFFLLLYLLINSLQFKSIFFRTTTNSQCISCVICVRT